MSVVEVGGWIPFTTIDYPGKLAAVIFLVGCPLKCAYCSNWHLQTQQEGGYDSEKILGFLQTRIGKLQAIVFSGGEALMQSNTALDYMHRVKELRFLIGLHTNGFYPNILQQALEVVDWVGLDIKTDIKNYEKLTSNSAAYGQAMRSLDILLESGKSFECRTTADPRFVTKESLLEIAHKLSLHGVRNFAVQKYNPYSEADLCKTTEQERMQFFIDDKIKKEINNLFESVVWRE